ncbi:tRNA (guanine(9)-N(1))-methyltransferase [Malassezia sp. CBS 17886]|nr:tRNA (guanine(9)-N(1))-methyltransferase [Malassezia sp. CBS 17886]
MFMLKSCDQQNMELIQLPAGALYLVRPGSVKGERECIYSEAVATIRRTTTPRNYELAVSLVYDAGEASPEREDDAVDECAFLIDEELQFHPTVFDGTPAFAWHDWGSGVEDVLEFIVDPHKVNAVTRSIFEVTFLQCVWERKTGRSHEEATDEDLEALKYRGMGDASGREREEEGRGTATGEAAEGTGGEVRGEAGAGAGAGAAGTQPPGTPARDATSPDRSAVRPVRPTDSLQTVTGTNEPQIVLAARADLYLYDQATGLFMRQEHGAQARIAEAGRFLYWMVVDGAEAPWLSQAVDSRMNMNFSSENLSAVWNYYDENGHVFSWLLRFGEKAAYTAFQEQFSHLLWETLNEEKWGKGPAVEQQYLEQAYEQDVTMTPADADAPQTPHRALLSPRHYSALSSDEDEDTVNAELDPMDEGDEDGGDEDEGDEDGGDEDEGDEDEVAAAMQASTAAPTAGAAGGDVNSQLAVGYKFDRSFVVRGDKIGVFRHTDDNRLEYATTINRISTPKGRTFAPGRAMLHDQDSAMVLTDPGNRHALYHMDLEYGKVVEEWKVHEDVPVANILPNSKFAQMTAEQTLIGTSRNGIFRIDPRLAGEKLVGSEFKQYTSKNDFSAAATDASGRLAVASNKGDLRLFDKIGKNAKTALPALGDPILGVDVSADGRWVIATCRTYLLLIDTLIGDGRFQGNLGFDRSFPADARPLPRRLQLRPHHVAYMETEVSFTPAHFNTGSDSETSIVTSTGNYVVSWSFDAVKKGNPYAYVLKRYNGVVVRDEHMYGSDQSIVVAFENDVQLAQRAQLRKPTRASLAPGPPEGRASVSRGPRRVTRG